MTQCPRCREWLPTVSSTAGDFPAAHSCRPQTELEAIRERVDAFDELQEMPMSLRFGTRHDLVLARDIIREYDRIVREQAQRIKELTSAGLKAYKALKKAKFHDEATAMYNALQGGQDE